MNYKELFTKQEFINLCNKLKYSDENNIFKILKLQNYEIRHSSYLAWLLKTHGLKSTFLEKLLKKANDKVKIGKDENINVYPEYNHEDLDGRIDILIEGESFVCVIENKYGSGEHDSQCKRYKDFIIEDKYPNKQHIFIYLDIFPPDKKLFEEKQPLEGYSLVTYRDLLEILPEKLYENPKNNNEITNNEILKQYREILNANYKILGEDNLSTTIKKLLQQSDILNLILNKECKENKDKIDECNAVWTIQSYLWATCYEKANTLIEKIYKDCGLEEIENYYNRKYGVSRCVPPEIKTNDIMIAFENNFNYKEACIQTCIVFNNKSNNDNLFKALKKVYDTKQKLNDGDYTVIKKSKQTLINKEQYIKYILFDEQNIQYENIKKIVFELKNKYAEIIS